MSQGRSTGPGWGTGVPADTGRALSRKRPLGLVLGYTYQQREGSLHHSVPHTGCSGSPGTAGPPRSPAGSSRCPPGAPVLFLGLRARLRAADSTICAGRLRHTGLRAAGSSCCRRLLSCCSSPQLLGTERPSVPVLRDKWPRPGCTVRGQKRTSLGTYECGSGSKVRRKAGLERQGVSTGSVSSCRTSGGSWEWGAAPCVPHPACKP